MSFIYIARSLVLFCLAGLAEIGGGYLVWQWLRGGKGILFGLVGGLILFLYGVIPTLQSESSFARIYAAYGGIFILISILWGIVIDRWRPDRYDLIGASIALGGIFIIMWGRKIF